MLSGGVQFKSIEPVAQNISLGCKDCNIKTHLHEKPANISALHLWPNFRRYQISLAINRLVENI